MLGCSLLDKEPETRKEGAISLALKHGFEVENININTSTTQWEIDESGKTLIQPLNSIKGLGDKAIEQIIANRPFQNVEELLFNKDIVYSKLNKKALDVLCRSGALDDLVDERFNGCKHFWMATIQDRPKNLKKLKENIELYSPEEDFTKEEKIEYVTSLTGLFPFELVLTKDIRDSIERYRCPPLGNFDKALGYAWFIPREVVAKQTKNGKTFWKVKVIDDTSTTTLIRCWGIKDNTPRPEINRPYVAKLSYNEDWGYSTRSYVRDFKLLG